MVHQSSVDLRRIQITMITLPKDWADSVGLKKNDTVGLQPQPDGSMVIYPGGEQAAIAGSTKIIDADGITDRDYLYRQLVGAYIAGHDVIELRSDGELSSMVASTASSFTQTAIGLEILEESENSIVIKDLMDQGEIKPAKSVERIGDHAVLLASNLKPIIEAKPTEVDDRILSTGRDVVTLFTDSVGTWSNRNMETANKCIERGEKLVERSKEIGDLDGTVDEKTAMAAELISGSVKRVAEYSMDIAEIAINSAMD